MLNNFLESAEDFYASPALSACPPSDEHRWFSDAKNSRVGVAQGWLAMTLVYPFFHLLRLKKYTGNEHLPIFHGHLFPML